MKEAINQIMPQLMEVVVALLGALVIYIKSGAHAWVQSHTKTGLAQNALLMVNDLVMTLVMEAEQTTGQQLRQDLEDGKITAAEFKASMMAVRDAVVAKSLALGRQYLFDGLQLTMDAAKALVTAKVEAAVPVAKTNFAAPVPSAP